MGFLKGKVKIIDQYIIGKYLGTFVYTLAIFVIIIVVFDLSEKMDDFMKSGLSFWGVLTKYYAGSIPFYVNMLSPLINFIAVIFFTAKMADQTEIVPILSGGVSFNRFLFPYFVSATVIFSANLVSNLYILPYTNTLKNSFENTYVKRNDPSTKSNIHMKLDNKTYIYIESFDNKTNYGYRFTLDNFNGDVMVKKIVADNIKWDSLKRKWQLSNYSIRKIDGLKESMIYGSGKVKDTILDMRPDDFSAYDNVVQNLSTKELSEKIQKEKIRGTGIMNDLEFEKFKRYLHPLSAYILTLIGVALSSRKVRGGVGVSLGIGIFISFAYIVFNQFTQMFSTKGGFPPFIAVLLPTIVFGTLGIYLLRKAPK
ncbi:MULTISPECIES: LptF/LptG family permease [Pedobacter]|uniref:LptF/LptG family permease n=1 Tax=Pedobacter agri TaxID=454586 RepID=A0A9X3DFG0_9SPHI|nr:MULTISPECIES: LptF/LptG family permease [Pedobacter]AZI27690.1 YjgP/YjgQ family permease [Pedobacter sp. G11]MCX3266689.1 LptF/LptG family permease [Pedobacter agri]RZJ76904.1 MAG: YjgP/YjgQ family permease [Flavobacterium sp.]